MKLNLGCGFRKRDGYRNVDNFAECAPDELVDLECFPWPWPDDSVSEVLMSHVLEHLGATTQVYFDIFRELYRVCRHDAVVRIIVPHPRHDTYIADPTHVRPITVDGLSMFSRRQCEEWIRDGHANTPIAIMLGVDFEMTQTTIVLDKEWHSRYETGKVSNIEMVRAIKELNNVVQETTIVMRVVKRYDT
jgi:predicted SAM-dependent methyltransferase